MKNLAFIPARAGSKRLPRKNLLPLNGIPLIVYTIKAAKSSSIFSKIVVSTDDEEIENISRQEGVETEKRQKVLSGDKVTVYEVVNEFLQRTRAAEKYDNIIALYPTSPLRDGNDIKNAFDIFQKDKDLKPLISISEYDFPPQFSLTRDENTGNVSPQFKENFKKTQSQSHKKLYHPNGAIFISKVKDFLKRQTFYSDNMNSYLMPKDHDIEIDYPFQFEMAEFLLSKKKDYFVLDKN